MHCSSARRSRSVYSLVLLAAGLGTFVAGSGCSSGSGELATSVQSDGPIVLDGNVEEWPQDVACVADGRFVHVRFTVQGEPYTLQAGRSTLSLFFDTDGDPETGAKLEPVAGAVLEGADLEIQMSPAASDAVGAKRGVAAFAIDRAGQKTKLAPGDAKFMFAPTYASVWYEARLTRDNPKVPGLASSRQVRGMMVQYTARGSVLAFSDAFQAKLPPMLVTERSGVLPNKPEGALRVVSYNVLKNKPQSEPASFARLLRALSPDIVLLQEWTSESPGEIQGWFETHLAGEGSWHAVKAEGVDASIVSRFPVRQVGETLEVQRADGGVRRVPVTSALVETESGDLFVSSLHLKCCGASGSPEDALRLDEARALNSAFRELTKADGDGTVCVVGGDLNLVGTRTPIDILRMGLDLDGSDLSIADAGVTGDLAFYTWEDDVSGFTPGRLDFVMFSDAGARAVQSFVVDTSQLSERELRRHGLERADSSASDHRPVVVDLKVTN